MRIVSRNVLLTSLVLLTAAASAFAGENWPQFRGPNADGTSDAKGLPLTFAEAENVMWKTPIHGLGWSSPVVWGDQVWLTTATDDGQDMFAVCVSLATGQVVHDVKLFHNEDPAFRHATNSYASPTPVIEQGRVYAHFGAYGTACLDTQTGKVLWQRRDFPCDHFRGPGSSPVLCGDALFVAYDGFDLQYVVALDKHTGQTLWKKDRGIDYGTDNGDLKKAYSTAAVIEHGGRTQIVSPSATETLAYAPEDGSVLWRVRHGGMNSAALPLFGNGLVYIAAGDGGMSLVAVRPEGTGDITDEGVVWSTRKSVPKRPSQLLIGDLYFMINDDGVATCLDAKNGDEIWSKRLEDKFWASPIYAEGRIYCFGQNGYCPVLEAGREFKLLAENELGDGYNASPAIVGKSIIARSRTHLYRIERR